MTALSDQGRGAAKPPVAARRVRHSGFLAHANVRGLALAVAVTVLLKLFVRAELIPEYLPQPTRVGSALWAGLFTRMPLQGISRHRSRYMRPFAQAVSTEILPLKRDGRSRLTQGSLLLNCRRRPLAFYGAFLRESAGDFA